MPALDKSVVKSWFLSRAKPFASQFASWIDACWFKGEKIPVADIEGLSIYLGGAVPPVTMVLSPGIDTYTIPAGYAIYKMYAYSTVLQTVSIGSAGDAEFYSGTFELPLATILPITIDIAVLAATVVKIHGLVGNVSMIIYLHKI